jgi:hypothetical protein
MPTHLHRRLTPPAIGVLVAAITVATIGIVGAAASPRASASHRLNAIEPYDQATETDTDLGDPGLSQADLSTFHFEVYDPTGAVHLGYETSQCVVGSVGEAVFTFDCSSDFVLTSGQIETEGTLEVPVSLGPRGLASTASQTDLTYHFAITGGTGSYRNVRGQLDWGNGEDAVILSFNLIG